MASMYCVKCRAKREDPAAVKVTMKNGKPALKGKCQPVVQECTRLELPSLEDLRRNIILQEIIEKP